MEEMLIEKVRQRTFLYDNKSPDYRDQHMRTNAREGIGKELKIKRKFYVRSRDVRIACRRLYRYHPYLEAVCPILGLRKNHVVVAGDQFNTHAARSHKQYECIHEPCLLRKQRRLIIIQETL
jgi:hypothetical protein